MTPGPGAVLGVLASGGVSVYCAARLAPSASTTPWLRRAETSHVLMGVVMAAMLLPPFTSSRAPWTAAAVGFGALALLPLAGRTPLGGARTGRHHPAHGLMLAAMAFTLVAMPPLRGTPAGPHAAHVLAGAVPPAAFLTVLGFACLLALAVERAATVTLLGAPVPAGPPAARWQALVRHPAGLPACDAVMCTVMAGMLASML